MHLAKVDIFGFKSFAKKTEITLHQGVTAVVGPNGCGKTNVVDAIRWALGEQKASVLRGERMESVIFNGSGQKKPLGMAEVSLLLDNSRKLLPIDYTEVLLTRRLYRSGESEYLLNKTPCRLKDLTDLFADTGIGPDAYSVIELKMVERILSDKSDERRAMFEEAAGITKFKQRRQAAMRKLEETDHDLLRVDDLLSEVDRTVNSLKRQVRKAERFNEFREILNQKDTEYYTYRWALIQKKRIPLNEQKSQFSDEVAHLSAVIAQHESSIETHREELQQWETRYNEFQNSYNQHIEALNREHMDLSVNQERIRFLTQQSATLRQECANLDVRLTQNGELCEEATSNLRIVVGRRVEEFDAVEHKEEELRRFYSVFNEKRTQVEAAQKEVIDVMQEFSNRERRKDRLESEIEEKERQGKRIEDEMQRAESRLVEREQHRTIIEEELHKLLGDIDRQAIMVETFDGNRDLAEAELSGIKEAILQKNHSIQNYHNQIKFLESFTVDGMGGAEGEKTLMASKDSVSGLLGVVDTILRVDEEYKRPIETALGKRAGYLVFDTAENAIKAMSYLREIKGGKASMIPMDIAARKAASPHEGIPTQDSRIVGKACDFVRYESEFGALASLLLSDTLIVRTELADWFGTTNGEYATVNVVDLSGNMIDRDGYLIGGDGEYLPKSDLFDKDREVERLRKEIQDAEKEILDLENEKRSIERKIEELVKTLSDATALGKKLNTRREELERQFAVLDHEISKDQEFASRMKKEKVQISLFQSRQEELETVQVEVREMEDRKQNAEQRMEELRHVAAELEQERSERESERQEVRMALLRTDEEIKRLKAEIAQREQNHLEYINRREENERFLGQYKIEKEELLVRDSRLNESISRMLDEKSRKDNQLEEIRNQQTSVKARISELEHGIRQTRNQRESLNQSAHEAEITLTRLEEEEHVIMEKLGARPMIDIAAWEGSEEGLAALHTELDELRAKLESFGQMNFAALEEYQTEKARLENLLKQRADIVEAELTLKETIAKINKTARDLFSDTFEKIRSNFREIFTLFFDQGEADCLLAGDDPLESRVEVVARPSGKRMQAISLLSAGEKTLTAIALLLAIYKVKPSPFCILDEVDAPLDDANIDRFVSAIRAFSRTTQFIVVTHNKRTMEAASYIYGVTMEEEGVSKIVSVRME